MTRGARTTLVLIGASLVAFLVAVAVLPVHVTLGAGSLRCGTVLRPDRLSEIAALCPKARSTHLTAAMALGALLSLVGCLPFAATRLLGDDESRVLRRVWSVCWIFVAVVGLTFIAWAVKYSPPHETFQL